MCSLILGCCRHAFSFFNCSLVLAPLRKMTFSRTKQMVGANSWNNFMQNQVCCAQSHQSRHALEIIWQEQRNWSCCQRNSLCQQQHGNVPMSQRMDRLCANAHKEGSACRNDLTKKENLLVAWRGQPALCQWIKTKKKSHWWEWLPQQEKQHHPWNSAFEEAEEDWMSVCHQQDRTAMTSCLNGPAMLSSTHNPTFFCLPTPSGPKWSKKCWTIWSHADAPTPLISAFTTTLLESMENLTRHAWTARTLASSLPELSSSPGVQLTSSKRPFSCGSTSSSPSTTGTFFLKRSFRSCTTGSANCAAFSLAPNHPLPPFPAHCHVSLEPSSFFLWSNSTPKEVVF